MSARAVRIRRPTPAGGPPPAPISANRRPKPRGGGEETVAGAGKGENGAPETETETGTSAETSGRSWYRSRGVAKCGRRRLKRRKERESVCVYTSCARMPGAGPPSRRLPPPPPWMVGERRRSEWAASWDGIGECGRGRSEVHRNLRRVRVARCPRGWCSC